ncbi:MAG: DUF4339 domain-containing protein [Xanthobacteraceae bacterium]
MHPQRQNSPQAQPALSGIEQWYVAKDERQYGPVPFGDLARFARQGLLLESDWIWKAGLDSWIPAADLSGLFVEAAPRRRDPHPSHPEVGDENTKRDTKTVFKERAKHQIKHFLLMFVYLWIVFGMFALHESIVLAQHQISYVSHGFAVVNALVFAKVMLVAEDLRLGHRAHGKPLIYSIIVKSILFAVALICFHVVEHVLLGMWHGQSIAEAVADVGANKLGEILSAGIIGTVALAPFFILSEISRIIGRDNFWALLFQRKSP